MRNDITSIVGISWAILLDHADYSANELHVWHQIAERPKNRRDTKLRKIGPFSEHLHLNDHIQFTSLKLSQNPGLIVGGEFAMDNIGF